MTTSQACVAGPPARGPGGASLHPPAMTALLSPAASATENSLSAADFARVRAMIHRHAGISLHEGKQAMVYSRLSRRLRDTGHPSFTSYLDELENGGSDSEWQQFVNCLTTNLTSFFREAHHFDALAQFLRSRRGQPLRGWCNAASTGEEPYSIAMTIAETLGPDAPVELMCSDIDTEVLGRAQRAVYPADARGLSPDRLKRHFMRGKGNNEGYIRVKPELARRVQFRTFNLVTTRWSELGSPFDFVFCRNVMIYFDPPTQRQLLQRIHAVMKPQGLLCVGHSENLGSVRELFKLRGQTTYERI